VFDVGANVGAHSKIFLDLGAKVIAIEPNDTLNKNFKNFNKNLTLVNVAVGSKNDEKELMMYSECGHNTLIQNSPKVVEYAFLGKKKVKIVPLITLIKKYGVPKFMKIDVELYEFEVLSTLNEAKSLPKFIKFEYNPHLTGELLKIGENCLDLLDKLGYKFNYSKGTVHLLKFKEFVEKEQLKEKLNKERIFCDVYASLI